MGTNTSPDTICILGCGGFIGSHLLSRLLATTNRHTIGIDITSSKIKHLLDHPNLTFVPLNIYDTKKVREYVEQSGTVISLVALCNPALYNTIPLDVIDMNFTRPLELVQMCTELGTWLIHFSTSEVYGKTVSHFTGCDSDPAQYVLSEDTSPLILGPVSAQRWSYACAKQLLERTIYAYGFEKDLVYTIVRPFNFIGPHMDFIPGVDGEGTPRVIACFMNALLRGEPLPLVDGGLNRRAFTYIDDAIDAVCAMLIQRDAAIGQIFNVGSVENEVSIANLASRMIAIFGQVNLASRCESIGTKTVSSREFYGKGYDDSDRRVPDISKARTLLGWEPKTGLDAALRKTIESYIAEYADECAPKDW